MRIAAALMFLVGAGACYRDVPLYCCDDRTVCNTDEHPFQTCAMSPGANGKTFCDIEGRYPESEGVKYTCIADPDGGGLIDGPLTDSAVIDAQIDAAPCQDAGTCPVGAPICRAGLCAACVTSSECPATSPVCEPSGRCENCDGEADCAGRTATPHCATNTGSCVECRTSTDCVSSGERPVCDLSSHECRRCRANDECSSDVCDQDSGVCVPETTVLYVNKSAASSGPSCTKAAPCKDINVALALASAGRNWIRVAAGQYTEQLRISSGVVTVAAATAGVVISPDGIDKPGILVTESGRLTLSGVTVRGGAGTLGVGVQCTGSGSPAPSIDVERSIITTNSGGGISVSSCDFVIRNSVIAANGTSLTLFGGVLITQNPPSGTGRLSFNTIVGNVAATSAGASGVNCNVPLAGLSFSSSIVYGNVNAPQVAGMCTFTYSDIGPAPLAGVGNFSADPLLTADYHLLPTSPCRNAADPNASITIDIDGDARPLGGRSDVGADEGP